MPAAREGQQRVELAAREGRLVTALGFKSSHLSGVDGVWQLLLLFLGLQNIIFWLAN